MRAGEEMVYKTYSPRPLEASHGFEVGVQGQLVGEDATAMNRLHATHKGPAFSAVLCWMDSSECHQCTPRRKLSTQQCVF